MHREWSLASLWYTPHDSFVVFPCCKSGRKLVRNAAQVGFGMIREEFRLLPTSVTFAPRTHIPRVANWGQYWNATKSPMSIRNLPTGLLG